MFDIGCDFDIVNVDRLGFKTSTSKLPPNSLPSAAFFMGETIYTAPSVNPKPAAKH